MLETLLMYSIILSQLIRGTWLIDPATAEGFKPIVLNILSGKQVTFERSSVDANDTRLNFEELYKPKYLAPDGTWEYDINRAVMGSIAVIPVKGVVMHDDYCGAPGTDTIGSWFEIADAHPNIIAHVGYVNTPGGSADGTKTLSDRIKNLSKPNIGFCPAMAASAGYWIISAFQKVYCSQSTDLVGSIGTYMTLLDWREYLKKEGIREIPVYADKSTRKNQNYYEAIDGNDKGLKTQIINPMNESFIAGVKKNRRAHVSKMTGDVFAGEIYPASQALELGLIDGIASFQTIIKTLRQAA